MSNIGTLRAKRKSSMIPQLSLNGGEEGLGVEGGARRVEMTSPAKRSRKMSMLGATTRSMSSMKVAKSPMAVSTNLINAKSMAPTWR